MESENQQNHFNNPVVIILLIALLGLGGYVLFSQKHQNLTPQDNSSATTQSNSQQDQMDTLKKEVEDLKNKKLQTIIKQVSAPTSNSSNQITSEQLASILDGVVEIECPKDSGTGSLWKFNNGYFVVTNNHVINQGAESDGSCTVIDVMTNGLGMYSIYPAESTTWNTFSDVAVLKLHEFSNPHKITGTVPFNFPVISTLDYKVGDLPKCVNNMAQGSPVIALGYPAYGRGSALITTNGVISGYGGASSLNAPYSNYIISAKIDSGNSGGVALSLNPQDQLCLLGIPTWVSTGNYENGGVVQNINNITYVK